ncbi:MAG: hypothetical protein OXP75_02830 [Rhodospirillales bacterium]|nr:hypothetical protein [Rhodospirillales bacterium]
MERGIVATRRRRSTGHSCRRNALKAVLLAGAGAVAMTGAAPVPAQVPDDERAYRREALAHAGAVEAAWRRLETWILEESTAAVAWPGAVPPAETGWQASWTLRGLEARYCDDVLLVYLAPEELKGTGNDHRAVHAAPHTYGGGDRPVLHWLENGRAEGGAGRAAVTLPACLSEAAHGGPLPSGRAALAGGVPDPFLNTVEQVTRERRDEPCPAGRHGEGRTLIREVTREHDGRGDPAGAPVEGSWEVSIDLCRDDYSQWEHYTLACHWDAGPPHNRRMEGREVWRRLRTVTATGESLGAPEFVSTSCWTDGALPPAPVPEVTEASHEETKSGSCPAGYVGSIGYRRTVTLRSTRFPWDEAPVTQTVRTPWTVERDDCEAEAEPDWGGADHGDHGGGPDGGTSGPGGDACGGPAPGETTGDVCSADGIGGLGGDGDGGGGDGAGGNGGCFLTTAVTERRGEPDDGPTLTLLRAFRDGYMTGTPERRALVAEYYAIAPKLVAAIPAGHAEWERIALAVDLAADAIADGAGDEAFAVYVELVRRLREDWGAAAGIFGPRVRHECLAGKRP